MTTQQLIKRFGVPNETGAGYLVHIALPYPMRLAWDINTTVNRMSCHKDVKNDFVHIFNDLFYTYGYDELKRLGIDLYGGCFNYRKMRGGNSWSTHSWGIAIDLNPAKNGLRTPYNEALFSKPEYKDLHRIFEFNGFENLGKTKNYDTMHFQKI